MKIVVNDIPPSNNEFLGNSRNFNIYRRKKEEWHWLIKTALKEKPSDPFKKAVVHIRYFFKDRRRRDPDNYSGKMILDPLVREGVLQDDNFCNIELRLSAGTDKERPRTEITITEVTEDGLCVAEVR